MKKSKVPNLFKLFERKVLDVNKLQTFLFTCAYVSLGSVGLIMSVVNFFSDEIPLMWSTLIFSVLSFINLILNHLGKRIQKIASVLFVGEIMCLFTFFLITGHPEGFSAFWIPLLPTCGLLLFGVKVGSIISAVMFADVVFFCWIPLGRSLLQFNYTSSFLLRFPFLYVGCYTVALLLSTVLHYTQQAYYNQSSHDTLTRVLNRTGFNKMISADRQNNHGKKVGFLITDLDHFKAVNDTYGHNIGDEVLKYVVNKLEDYCQIHVCRWGGEEFAIYFPDGDIDFEYVDSLRKSFENSEFKYGDITINQTISVGAILADRTPDINADRLCRFADECLYEAKRTGRNKTIFKDLTKE